MNSEKKCRKLWEPLEKLRLLKNNNHVRYAVILEKAKDGGYGAYVPDLPGCLGMGETRNETIENISEAIKFHIEGMKAEKISVPLPHSDAENLIFTTV